MRRKLLAVALGMLVVACQFAASHAHVIFADQATVGGQVYEGVEIQIDLPKAEHVKNFGGPKDGKGLCVFASMTMAARWHNIIELADLMYWDKDGKPHSKVQEGGGWPGKVDDVLKEFAPKVKYAQYEGTDTAILDKALSEGSPACVTYGYGERYGMQTIYHMVILMHFDAKYACVLDNNFPGTYEWMSRDEFLRRWKHVGGKGWAYTFLEPPPPPVPHN